jgi:hypothetical protein
MSGGALPTKQPFSSFHSTIFMQRAALAFTSLVFIVLIPQFSAALGVPDTEKQLHPGHSQRIA